MRGLLWHGFQSHPHILEALTMLKTTELQIFYVDVVGYHQLIREHGKHIGEQLLGDFYQYLQDRATHSDTLVVPLWDDAFLIIAQVQTDTFSWLNDYSQQPLTLANGMRYSISFHAGVSWLQKGEENPGDLIEKMFNALEHAAGLGKLNAMTIDDQLAHDFEHIIMQNLIQPYYQPIINTGTGAILGYEALARGPKNSRFRLPGPLFEYGARLGQLGALDLVCREAAIASAPTGSHEFLFLNINPQSLNDPTFVKGRTRQWAAQKGIDPTQIVFEITEHEAIVDYPTFRKTVDHYRNQGFKIAIDDTGSGYSGLLTLVELNPHFVKLDRGLIENINNSSRKQAMVEAMVMVARKIGAKTIAEGIETQDEYRTIIGLGVDYGQGYLLGRPAPALQLDHYAVSL